MTVIACSAQENLVGTHCKQLVQHHCKLRVSAAQTTTAAAFAEWYAQPDIQDAAPIMVRAFARASLEHSFVDPGYAAILQTPAHN